jgi:hypothetical protein
MGVDMKKWFAWVASGIVLGGIAAASVHAAQLTFTPRISLTEAYNDNIDLDRRNKMDDWITTVSPGATLEWLGQAAGLRLSYDPAYSFYADHDEYNSWSHRAGGSVWYDYSRSTRFSISNYFTYTKDPLSGDVNQGSSPGTTTVGGGGGGAFSGVTPGPSGPILIQGNDRARNRDRFYSNYASGRADHQFGPENRVYTQMAYLLSKYDDPAESDGQSFTPSAGLSYWFSTWNGVDVDASYTRGLYEGSDESNFDNYDGRVRFNHRISRVTGVYGEYHQIYRKWDDPSDTYTDGGSLQQDYLVYAPSVGVFHEFDPTLKASLGVGYFYQQVKNDTDQSGPFLQSDINKFWDFQRWSVRLRSASGIDSQDFSGDQQGFERYVLAEAAGRYNFTRDFFGDLALRARYSDFLNSEDNEKDLRYTLDAGLGYALARWATVRVGYTFNKLDAINSTDDYVQNVGYVTLTLSPDQPWRIFD